MTKILIVGSGATGLLFLWHLQKSQQVKPNDIVIVDPHHDGGDLQRRWATVRSNTIWGQTLSVFDLSGASIPAAWKDLDPAQPAALQYSIAILRHLTRDFMSQCEVVHGFVDQIEKQAGGKLWSVTLTDKTNYTAPVVILAHGSEPKQLLLPIPSIPLDCALSKSRLETYVTKNSRVLLFGTSHSGTLIMRNLHELDVQTTAFYTSEKPFYFARDGEYDGIKQDSAEIADAILAKTYPNLQINHVTDTAQVIRAARKADWVIYATGFKARTNVNVNLSYDGKTGEIADSPGVWGFGIAFPNKADDDIHWDVSIPSFHSHIQKQMPAILKYLSDC
jgi:cation diffusion facilitator CzcD-associated flavoprotein CzcO